MNYPLMLRGAVACVAATAVSACNPSLSAAEMLEKARQRQAAGDAAGAFFQIKSALQENPDSAPARYQLGLLFLAQGEPSAAEMELRRALGKQHPPALVLPALAQAMLAGGKNKALVDEFGNNTLADPEADAKLRLHIATAHAALGQRQAARGIVDGVLAKAANNVDALLLDAKLKISEGDADGGFNQVSALAQREPGNADVWQFLGDLRLFSKGDISGAAEAFQKVIAIQPRSISAQSYLIAIRMRERNDSEAQRLVEQMRTILPQHPQTKIFEAQLAFLRGDFMAARDISSALLLRFPNNLPAMQLVGAAEFKRGAYLSAESHLNKAMSLAPDLILPRRLLAQTYLKMGQLEKALTVIRPAVDRPDATTETLETAAEVYISSGNAAAAESLYLRVAKVKPNDPAIKTAIALTQYARGQDQAALNSLELIAASDRNTVADFAIISTRIKRNELDKALNAIAGLALKMPDSPLPNFLSGRTSQSLGDFRSARASFEAALVKQPAYFAAIASLAKLDLLDGKAAAAQTRLEAAIAANPRNAAAQLALADLRLQVGASRASVTPLFEAAVNASPADPNLRVALIDHLLASKALKAAMAAAQQAVTALPNAPEVFDAMGRAQQANGEVNQAIATFSKVASLVPKSPVPPMRIAQLQLSSGNPAGALASIKRALEIDPYSREAQRIMMTTAIVAKRPQDAVGAATAIQKRLPNDAVGYIFAGDIEAHLGRWPAAAQSYRMGVGKSNPGNLPNRLHLALKAAKQNEEAGQFAVQWLKSHPNDTGFLFYLGELAITDRDPKAAESRFTQVVKLEPENALALNNLSYLHSALGKPDGLELALRANVLLPNSPPLLDTLAMSYSMHGDNTRAIETAKRAADLGGADTRYRLTLARLYLHVGDKVKAKTELQTLAKMGTANQQHAEVASMLKQLE